MSDSVVNVIQVTYTTLLPIVLGYIVGAIKDIKKNKAEQKKTQQEISDAIKEVHEEVKAVARIVEDNKTENCRYRIIRFDDEMTQGIDHSDDHVQQILGDINTYHAYCKAHPDFVNHQGQGAMGRILAKYNKGEDI